MGMPREGPGMAGAVRGKWTSLGSFGQTSDHFSFVVVRPANLAAYKVLVMAVVEVDFKQRSII